LKGRKPKPTHLHVVNGNPGKHSRNKAEPQPPKGIPSPPEHISAAARVAWGAMSVKLDEMGVLAYADVWALEQLSENYAEILAWRRIIDDEGRMVDQIMSDGETVRRVVNPVCIALSDAEKRFKAMMCEFGLTPSSRSRVNSAPKEKGRVDPAAKYFG
jgi:P27 family predicted phage terminase small subunit